MSLKALDKLIESVVLEATPSTPPTGRGSADNILLNLVKPTEIGMGATGGGAYDAKFFLELSPSIVGNMDEQYITKIMQSIETAMTTTAPADLKDNFKSLFYATQLYSLFQDWDEASLGYIMESFFAPIIRKNGGEAFRPSAATDKYGADFVYGTNADKIAVNYKTVAGGSANSSLKNMCYDHGIPYFENYQQAIPEGAVYKVFWTGSKDNKYILISLEKWKDIGKKNTNQEFAITDDSREKVSFKEIEDVEGYVQKIREGNRYFCCFRNPEDIIKTGVSFFIRKKLVTEDQIVLEYDVKKIIENNISTVGLTPSDYVKSVFKSASTRTDYRILVPKGKKLGKKVAIHSSIPLGVVIVLDGSEFNKFFTSLHSDLNLKKPLKTKNQLGKRIKLKAKGGNSVTIKKKDINDQLDNIANAEGNFFTAFESWMRDLSLLLTKFLSSYDKKSTTDLNSHFENKDFNAMFGKSVVQEVTQKPTPEQSFVSSADPTMVSKDNNISLDLKFDKIFSLFDPANPQRKVNNQQLFKNFVDKLATTSWTDLNTGVRNLVNKMNKISTAAQQPAYTIDSEFLSAMAIFNTFDYVFRNFDSTARGFSSEKVIGAILGGVEIPATLGNSLLRVEDVIFPNQNLGVTLKSTDKGSSRHDKASSDKNFQGSFNIPIPAERWGKGYISSKLKYNDIDLNGSKYKVVDRDKLPVPFKGVSKFNYLETTLERNKNEIKMFFDTFAKDIDISETNYDHNSNQFNAHFQNGKPSGHNLSSFEFVFDFQKFHEVLTAQHENFYKFIKSIEKWYVELVFKISQYMKTFDPTEAKSIIEHLNNTDWRDNDIFKTKMTESLDSLIEAIIRQKLLKIT